MAKRNLYSFEKRQKEFRKQKKKEEKAEARHRRKEAREAGLHPDLSPAQADSGDEAVETASDPSEGDTENPASKAEV